MGEPIRILIVDDDQDVRWMLRRYLTKHGYAIDTAEDSITMRQATIANTFQLVVLDLNMPGEDGLSLARYLREHHDLAIIMLTAASEVVDRVIGPEVGADDYVTKPFEPRELLARIKNVLRRFRGAAQTANASDDSSQEQIAFSTKIRPLGIQVTKAKLIRSPAYDLGASADELRGINLAKLSSV